MTQQAEARTDEFERLARRCEEETTSCRSLNEVIFARVRGWSYPIFGAARHEFDALPNSDFTGSLDAAVTLVPKGFYWHAGHGKTRDDEPIGGASVIQPGSLDTFSEGEAETAPLAICAAALRALAKTGGA